MDIYCVKEVEQNPLPKSQTKPFYIGTKEAPSDFHDLHFICILMTISAGHDIFLVIFTCSIFMLSGKIIHCIYLCLHVEGPQYLYWPHFLPIIF